MKANRLALAGTFCWNRDCPDYGKAGRGNIVKYGKTAKGTQRLKCTTCEKVFVENRGTVFYGKHHSPHEIMECLAMVAEKNSLASIHRIKGIKEETVSSWLLEAADHVEVVESLLLANYPLTREKLDAMWANVEHKGEKVHTPKSPRDAASGVELQ
ncbi:MAG: IS1 family transposase [Methanosarcinales archaeon]|nr:IS1 family transposase [Methanosarcinales archaeon]